MSLICPMSHKRWKSVMLTWTVKPIFAWANQIGGGSVALLEWNSLAIVYCKFPIEFFVVYVITVGKNVHPMRCSLEHHHSQHTIHCTKFFFPKSISRSGEYLSNKFHQSWWDFRWTFTKNDFSSNSTSSFYYTQF